MTLKQSLRWFWSSPAPEAQRLRRLARLLLLLALFISLFWVIPIQRVIQAILTADPFYLGLGLLLSFISTCLTALEMEPLTRKQGLRHSILEILEINLAVKFYSQFAPSSLVGSGMRWYRLAQPGGKVAESLAALAFFRLLETFLTLALGLGFWLVSGGSSAEVNIFWVGAVILAVVLGWVLITRYSLSVYRWSRDHSGQLLERPLLKPLARRFEKFLVAVSAYADLPAPDLLLALTAGILSALAGITSGTYLAQAVGIQINFLTMGWIQAVMLLATSLPFAVAGGVGIREVTLVALLSAVGVSVELSLALSFLLFVRGVLISLIGGILEAVRALRERRASVPEPPDPRPENPDSPDTQEC